MGVASAALVTGVLVDTAGWRSAFIFPGIVSIVIGLLYLFLLNLSRSETKNDSLKSKTLVEQPAVLPRQLFLRILGIILFTTAIGGLVFQSTTFSLPKVFDEKLTVISGSMSSVGLYVFLVLCMASFAQLVVGYLIDKHSVRPIFATVAALQVLFFLVMSQLDGLAVLPVAIAFMLVVFGQIPINDVLIGRISRSQWRSRAYALRSIVSFLVMAATLPLVAWIHGQWGFNVLFVVLSGAAMLIFLATLYLPTNTEFSIIKTAN